jgi:hypothetical protein
MINCLPAASWKPSEYSNLKSEVGARCRQAVTSLRTFSKRMHRALTALLCFVVVSCYAGKNADLSDAELGPITLEVVNSLRIPAHRVKIHLEANRRMTVEIQNRNEDAKNSERILGVGEMTSLQALASRIDWKQVDRDDVLGLDGASVRVRYRGEDYSVWTPSDDSRKRRLGDFLDLKNEMFRLGGLTEEGLPQ